MKTVKSQKCKKANLRKEVNYYLEIIVKIGNLLIILEKLLAG